MAEMVCVKYNGVSYCWNFETKKVEVFTRESIDTNDCPVEVMYELMVLISEKAKEG